MTIKLTMATLKESKAVSDFRRYSVIFREGQCNSGVKDRIHFKIKSMNADD